jgi:hypothetical protein
VHGTRINHRYFNIGQQHNSATTRALVAAAAAAAAAAVVTFPSLVRNHFPWVEAQPHAHPRFFLWRIPLTHSRFLLGPGAAPLL